MDVDDGKIVKTSLVFCQWPLLKFKEPPQVVKALKSVM